MSRSAPTSARTDELPPSLSYKDLFVIFLKAGLAFGGGLGMLAVIEDELVSRRRAVTHDEFLTIYGLGRIVPSGTMTALAVGYGYKFKGLPGTLVTMSAMVLPGFVLTVLLTMSYAYLRNGPLLAWVPVTILPAALGLVVVAALRLGRQVFRPSIDLVLALLAFVGAFLLGLSPALLLIIGGVVGVVVFRGKEDKRA